MGKYALILCSIFILLTSCQYFDSGVDQFRAKDGVLDLRNWDFSKNPYLKIRGEWDFYWNMILEPKDFQGSAPQKTGVIGYPSIWNHYKLNGTNLPGYGYATYRLQILLPETNCYGFKIYDIDTAYQLWINGEIAVQAGKVGTSKEESIPMNSRMKAERNIDTRSIELVLQVCNFYHRKGGTEQDMIIGLTKTIRSNDRIMNGFELIGMGTFLIIVFYHFVMYIYRRKDVSLLFFALFCLAYIFRLLTVSEKTIYIFFPDFPFEMDYKLQYISFSLTFLFFFEYANRFFQTGVPNWFYTVYRIVTGLYTLFLIVFPVAVYSHSLPYIQVIYTAGVITTLTLIFIGLLNKKKGSGLFLASASIMILGYINDTLLTNNIIYTGYLFHYGFFFFIYLQIFILTRKFTVGLNAEETLTSQLRDKSIELEKEIGERKEYAEQLRQLSTRQIREEDEQRRRIAMELHDSIGQYLSVAEMRMDQLGEGIGMTLQQTECLKDSQDLIRQSMAQVRTLTFALSPPILYDLGLEEALDWLAEEMEKKYKIRIEYNPDSNSSGLPNEKRMFLFRSARELIMNGIKHSQSRTMRMTTHCREGMYGIEVSDNGVGFEIDSEARKGVESFGLFSIAERASHIGGSMRIESEAGKGTRVYIEIPVG